MAQGDPPHLDVVFRRHRDVELGGDVAVAAAQGGLVGGEGDQVFVGFDGGRLVRRRPDRAAGHVAQVDRLAGRIGGGVAAPAGDRPAAPAAAAAAGVGDDGDVGAVGEELPVRHRGVRRAIAPDRHRRDGRRHPHFLGDARDGRRREARHPLLEQQLGGLDPRIGVEAPDHHVVQQHVGQRHQHHPLVVAHVGANHRRRSGRGVVEPIGLDVAGHVVDRLEEAELAAGALAFEPPQVGGCRQRIDQRAERGGVRRDDQLVAEAAGQAEPGHAEGLVLVGAVAIDGAVGRFRDAPRHAQAPPVLDLPLDGQPARLVEQGVGVAPHQQQRHQVLERRRAPRQQHRRAVMAGEQAAEAEPVALRHVALGDGEEAGEAGFRGQQVVVPTDRAGPGPRRPAAGSRWRTAAAAGRRGSRSPWPRTAPAPGRPAAPAARRAPATAPGTLLRYSCSAAARHISDPARLPLSTVDT